MIESPRSRFLRQTLENMKDDAMQSLVQFTLDANASRIVMDDGKANIMSPVLLAALRDAFDQARGHDAPVVLSSGGKHFSAGFDLKVIREGSQTEKVAMLRAGAELALQILSFPRPVISVCQGNALPMGAFMLLCSDIRLAAEGDYGISMNEVMIGLTVPLFAIEIARQRLTPAYFNRAVVLGERYAPHQAASAGFVDMVVPPADIDQLVAQTLAGIAAIDYRAHAETKARVRKGAIDVIRAAIESELVV
jgi:enoyl-CoA hydratase